MVDNLIYPVILGTDFLARNSVSLQFSGMGLRVTRGERNENEIVPPLASAFCATEGRPIEVVLYEESRRELCGGLPIMLLDCEAVSDDTIRDEVAIPNFAEAALEIPQDVPSFLTGVLRGFDETFSVKPGKTTVAEHRIRVTDSTPVKVPVRRLPMAFREEVQQQLQTMLDQGIIVPSNSPYMAPCVFVLKKSGEYAWITGS
jgi:hypothetical protein